MRIGFDIGPITASPTGVGHYARSLLGRLLAQASGDEFLGLGVGARRPVLGDLAGRFRHKWLPVPARLMYKVWGSLGVPRVDRLLGGVDVYHATNFFLPPVRRARRVLSIHDLAFLARPELCSPKVVGPFSAGIRRFVRDADAVLTFSEATKADIVDLLDVDPAGVRVTYHGVDAAGLEVTAGRAIEHVREVFGLEGPYVLFVGTLEPRKNIPTLVSAFAAVADEVPHSLVLAGGEGWDQRTIAQRIEETGIGERVKRLGYVDLAELPALYTAADAFAFPSHYEGFGLPVLEAMACGCPVVASNSTSLPEVAGDAALLVDPVDQAALAEALRRILTDAALREELIAKGRQRVSRFTWEACARETLDLYHEVARCS